MLRLIAVTCSASLLASCTLILGLYMHFTGDGSVVVPILLATLILFMTVAPAAMYNSLRW